MDSGPNINPMKQKETTHLTYEPSDLLENIGIMSNAELQEMLSSNDFSTEIKSQALCDILSEVNVDKTLTLLKAGADPNYQNGTPLVVLANSIPSQENVMCLDLLHEFGCKMDGTNGQNQGFATAILEGNNRLVERMLEIGGMDLTWRGSEALTVAASEGNTKAVELLVQHEPNQDFNEAFCMAAEYGHTEIMDILITKVNQDDLKHDALERATFFGEYDSVYHMIDKQNFSVNNYDNSFISTALESKDSKFVDYTISKLDKPLQVVQDMEIMGYVQLYKPELMNKITERMKESVQENAMRERTTFDNTHNQSQSL